MTDTEYAPNVCHVCMLRKKACDKALPACDFCVSRQLLCRYDISALKNKGLRKYNPGRHFVPLQSPSPPNVFLQSNTATQLYIFPQSVEKSLNQLTDYFTKLTKLTCNNIVDCYFQNFHKWLPVVSPDSFRREASRCQEEGCIPPADFTVLLLTMLLIILPTLDPSLRPPRSSQELLYMTTKSAISQAQASVCTSLRLVQAAFLIALREYTCVRLEAAYISMMTCAGLARITGIRITSVRNISEMQRIVESQLEETETENLALAIAMLERYM